MMATPYTQINLGDVEDAAPGNDLGSYWEARVARAALDAEQTGVTHFVFGLANGRRLHIDTHAPRRST
jgi:hypothetical protein